MTNTPDIKISVICFTSEDRKFYQHLVVSASSTVADVLSLCLKRKDFLLKDFSDRGFGINGDEVPIHSPLKDGDRVEIYRPLFMDANSARKARSIRR